MLFAVGLACVGAGAQAPASLDYPALLQRLVDVQWLWQPPIAGERCVQFSSYNRRSDGGPGKAKEWYANDDRGHYLRAVERDGRREHVMVDVEGPGCLARLWSANPGKTIHFDIDGERWSVDFGALCRGEVAGVPAPLAAMRSRGGNVYLPIPFQQRLVVSAEHDDLYYLADVVRFAEGAQVPSFTAGLLEKHAGALATMAEDVYKTSVSWSSIWPLPAPISAGSMVRGFTIHVDKAADRKDLLDVLRRTRLRIYSGSDDLVNVPVMDFFCGGGDWQPWRSKFLGITEEGDAWCRFPMPFPERGKIHLRTDGGAGDVKLTMSISLGPEEMGPSPLLFHADYHIVKGTPTRPFTDHLVLDAKGRGRFVGCSLLVRNPSVIWWGEGDEKFYVDGETFPSWFGTGTEDYFGYAWCDPTPFQAPLHAQVLCQGPRNFGFTQLHRTHLLDSVPFQSSFRFELERWHWVKDIEMDYATVAYWYGAPGAASGLPDVPSAAERHIPLLDKPKMFQAEGALEGEQLRIVSCSGGEHMVQNLGVFEETFSLDEHRWWRDGKVGDALVLGVPVAEKGRYRVTAAFVQANDFAIVKLSLGGQPLGESFDGYRAEVGTTGPLVLGTVELDAGEQPLRVEITGKNALALERHMFGLDYVKLEKLP